MPVSAISLQLKSGPRAPLATPLDCGRKSVSAEFQSWSGATAVRSSDLTVDCPGVGSLAPTFKAGVIGNLAGRHARFVLRVERADRQQIINGLSMRMPTGLLATLRGVPRCPDDAANTGACPELKGGHHDRRRRSRDQSVLPTGWRVPHRSYKRGPFGLAVAIRAKAGPFALGTVIVRQQLLVDPVDAHVTVVSDPLPTEPGWV